MTATHPDHAAPAPAADGDVASWVAASNRASTGFFVDHADAVAAACEAMARRFQCGGRLLVHGTGAQRSDTAHVVVEFVHPVVVGKRALPAISLPGAGALDVLGREQDILMLLRGIAPSADDQALSARARDCGMLVLALTGSARGTPVESAAHFSFVVPSDDPLVVQETHEMLYHVLWELVHVFFEHRTAA